jgi:hypothetical protein
VTDTARTRSAHTPAPVRAPRLPGEFVTHARIAAFGTSNENTAARVENLCRLDVTNNSSVSRIVCARTTRAALDAHDSHYRDRYKVLDRRILSLSVSVTTSGGKDRKAFHPRGRRVAARATPS